MSNKKILNNSFFLYIRLFITLSITLFTTRIVLNNLGLDDYGVYGAIGSIVALIIFLQNSLSGATNRFFNIEIVKNDISYIQKLFSTSLFLHVAIALFICFLIEFLGLFAINNYLNLPVDKVDVARELLHFSVLSIFTLIITIPFEALLITKENFKSYAYISIFDTFLKLIVAYFLIYFDKDRLFYYAFGLFLSSFLTRSLYVYIVKKRYIESKIIFSINKDFLKKIISFISWDLYGNFAVVLKIHGTTLILNNFFGLIMVASVQIGNQILTAISSFSSNLLLAARPQLMRSYAEKNITRMNDLTIYTAKYSYYFILILCIPIAINIKFILNIWLINVPAYAQYISIFSLLTVLINSTFNPIITLIHASGNIKKISLLTGTLIITVLPLIYIVFSMGFNYHWAYIISLLNSFIAGLLNTYILKKIIPCFDMKRFFYKVVFVNLLITLFLFLLFNSFYAFLEADNFFDLLINSLISIFCSIIIIYIFGVEKTHKKYILLKINFFLDRLR